MAVAAPLKITLYNPETKEPIGEYICNFVPFKFLKLALRLAVSTININADALGGLIVELFGRQFSVDELMRQSDENDRIAILQAIMNRTGMTMKIGDEQSKAESAANKELPPSKNSKEEEIDEDWIMDLEISLIKAFGWSLHDIDETDIESLMPFVAHYAGTRTEARENMKGKKKVFCDQVSWL
jgi:hypothetical protein